MDKNGTKSITERINRPLVRTWPWASKMLLNCWLKLSTKRSRTRSAIEVTVSSRTAAALPHTDAQVQRSWLRHAVADVGSAHQSAPRRAADRRAIATAPVLISGVRPHAGGLEGSSFFCRQSLQSIYVQRLLRHNLFQADILRFQFAQPLQLTRCHACILVAPAVHRLF